MSDEIRNGARLLYIDVEAALKRIRGNKTMYARMLGLFLESREMEMLRESLTAGDYAKAAEYAHAVKGLTGNLSLTALFEQSVVLMEQLRNGEPAQADIDRFWDISEKTRDCVKELIASKALS